MKKLFALSSVFVLILGFQNCSRASFASDKGSIRNLPYECHDQASCLAPAAVLGRYFPTAVTEVTYSRSLSFAPIGQRIEGARASFSYAIPYPIQVHVALVHAQRKLVISNLSPAATSIGACQIELGSGEYENLMDLLTSAYLAPATSPSISDSGVGVLELLLNGQSVSHIFESSESLGATELIFNGGSLEVEFRRYSYLTCTTSN